MIEIKQENATSLKEELYNTIKNAPNVNNVKWINKDIYSFSRVLSFSLFNKEYIINWAWNESSLYFGNGSMFRFNRCELSGTWPNKYKNNLQFYLNDTLVAVIPVEAY